MGDTKLFLLLLLCSIVLAEPEKENELCLLAKRYKSLHKYEYLYEAESLNVLNGAINGPKFSCKVEIEVPGTCQYIVHTQECTMSEVMDVDADENPVFGPPAGADTFKAEMEKNPLKVIVEGDNDIKLFPQDGELINILNIKRGIISALVVPGVQEEMKKEMPTIYGLCKTDYIVNSKEDVTLNRDLSKCDQFRAIKGHTSPLALFTDRDFPADLLLNSKQTCNYKFDNQMNHMTSAVCTENHLVKPFSYKEKYGATSVGKQMLSLLGVTKYNERVFDYNEANMKSLHIDSSVDISSTQDENAILAVLRELAGLSQTSDGHKRAHLAYKLVAMMRKTNADTLSTALEEAMKISPSITYQALFQCGSQECSSALMKMIRTRKSAEIDAVLYAMGMVPNPTRVLVKDMLEMAKLKPSKLVYYALSNAVRRHYQSQEKVTPEIRAVADYALEQIGDCTGDQEHTYLTLRVIGNMAAAVYATSPALKSAVIQCINQPASTPEVQQAAIQSFRLIPLPEEGRSVLMKVLLDKDAPVQKRIAAYLILMKDPQPNELDQLATALPSFENLQVKSFVISHLTNILSSTDQETQELRNKILDALQGNEVGNVMNPTKFSRNYKISYLEGNMIFEEENKLPKEVVLEMALNAFGYYEEMVEVGMESKGLEPTVEALFGSDGFFPDTVLKTIFFATDNMPAKVNEVLNNMIPALANERKKRQVSKSIIKEITKNFDKLIKNLKAQDTPEAMLYLRVMGAELGYLKTKDIEDMAYVVAKMAGNLVRMFPTDYIKSLFSNADNGIFLHYIYLDDQFSLPTGPGVPLKFGLSGTFTPGIKGGLKISPDMSEIAFMPSAGIEIVTEIGTHLPDYVDSGLEMHTNLYHESGLRAKFTMAKNQITLTLPSANPMELLSITNSLVSVAGSKTKSIPATMAQKDMRGCHVFLPGAKLCTVIQFPEANADIDSPYFPLTGDSKFALELHPSYDVSAYTATIKYELVESTDKVTFVIKPEGTSTEAQVDLRFNREHYTTSVDLQIPDCDIEAGIRIGAADSSIKGKATHSIQMDFINKKVTQASLVGLAKIETMNDAQLQVQLLVPALDGVAKATASLKRAQDLTVELESDLKFLNASSIQKIILKYDDEKIEAEIKSNVSAKTEEIISKLDTIKNEIIDVLDQPFGEAEMKVRDMLTSSVEATHNYLEASKIPFMEKLQVPAFPEIDIPENLFLNIEADAKYFYNDYYTITLPMPLGGKSTKDLNIPPALATPSLAVPQLGLDLASIRIPLPEVCVPKTLTVSLPIAWRTEAAGKLSSNLYDLDATVSAGRESTDHQSYSARVKVTGTSPVDVLSIKVEGAAVLTGILSDSMRAEMNTAVSHKLLDASISLTEEVTMNENTNLKSISKLDAKSPLGLKLSLEHTGQVGFNKGEISGDNNVHGSFVTGPVKGDVTLTQSIAVLPFIPEAKYDSLLKVDSTPFQGQNKMEATFSNGELSVVSKTAAFNDRLTHNAEVALMKSKFAVKSITKASALGMKIQNSAEANIAAGDMRIKIETTSSRSEDHINSLVTATVDANGLVLSSDSSIRLAKHTATQKASMTLNKNGMATTGTTSINSFMTLNNTFNGILHSSKGSLSVETVGNFGGMAIDNTNTLSASMASVALSSKSQVSFAKDVWYMYDISVQAEPYSANVDVTNHLRLAPDTELKQTCEMKFADLTGMAKCSANGKLMGAQLSHDTEMEIIGVNIRYKNDAQFNSQLVHFTNTLQATAAPFHFNLHALTNGDGELHLFGKHSAQVFTKVLVKAEPFSFAHSHECRLSVTHELNNNVILETNFDNKVDTLLSPSVQSGTVRMKTKINDNIINQEFSAYNNQERIGLEVSGVVKNLAFSSDQDLLSVSAFLKYDKTTESHVINLQLLESLPAILEEIKMASVNLAEGLQDYIKREEFAVKIQTLLQHFSDFINKLNIEEQAVQLKKNFITLAQNCPVNTKDLEAAVTKLEIITKNIIAEIGTHAGEVQDMILNGDMSEKIIQKITELNKEYDIHGMVLALIEAIEDIIDNQFSDGTDELNVIKLKLQRFVREIKLIVKDFDAARFADNMKELILIIEDVNSRQITEQISSIAHTMKLLITELNITGKCKALYKHVKAVAEKYELDKKTEELLNKIADLIKQFKINQTVQAFVNHLKSIDIPFKHLLDDSIAYLKNTKIKQIIEDVNESLEGLVRLIRSLNYNTLVDQANQEISEYTTKLNAIVVSLELPQKAEATREFLNYAFSLSSSFLQKLRATKVSEMLKSMKDLFDSVALNDIKTFAEKLKLELNHLNLGEEIRQVLQHVNDVCVDVFAFVTRILNDIAEVAIDNEAIVTDLKQKIKAAVSYMQTAEIKLPSFPVPFTDLVLPSMKFSLHQLEKAEIPTEFNLPQFTILESYTVPAMTITCADIKDTLMELIDFIINFDVEMLVNNAYIEDLTLNFLPDISAISLPEITVPHIAFPAIPKLNDKFMLEIPLQIPEIKLPQIPSEIAVPTFGKLYSEIRFNSPIYTLRTSAEIRNSTDNQQKNHLIAFFSSVGECPNFNILNYKLDVTTRIGIPKMSRVVIAETLKFIHSGLTVEHQASVTLYGLSAQAIAQTTVKATTTPYNAELVNKAFLAVEGGMTASFDTTYKHQVNVPLLSLTSDASLTQSTVLLQKGTTFSLTVKNAGNDKCTVFGLNDEFIHKSDLSFTMDPASVKLTFTGDTDIDSLCNVKKTLNAEAAAFKHIGFNGKIETKSPFIKNSVMVASGWADLKKMKLDVGATHDTELVGVVSGMLSNALNIKARPIEISVDFQNKANTKVNFHEIFSTKIDLQNDYAAVLNSKKQHINSAALVRFNQHKYHYNFTIDNNNAETGIYAAVNGETDLEFLNVPISIPEIVIPEFDVNIQAINDVNLYEYSGLKDLMAKPTLDVNAKVVYQKSKVAPVIYFGFVQAPALGNLISEMSFKSSLFNLNTNAGIYGDNDLVVRITAASTSVFEKLNANLEGTSSLTLKRGLKLATTLSLKNAYIEGTHNSTVSLNRDKLEAAVALITAAKMNLPVLSIEANHNLLADTKTNLNAASTLTVKHKCNIPIIKAVGNGDAKYTFKLDGSLSQISVESTAKGMIDGTFLDTGIVNGALDNEATMTINDERFRSTMKTKGNVNINNGNLKVQFDLNEDLNSEATLGHVYTVLNSVYSNEVNIANFNTKGKHTAKATINAAPVSSLVADIEFDLSQPSTLGDLSYYEKTVVDLTLSKISYTAKLASPVYTTNIVFEVNGNAPVFKAVFKSSATSPVGLLAYDLDSYISTEMENEGLTARAKAYLKHNDLTMDMNSVVKSSAPSHELNVDITSPKFTDLKIRYVAEMQGLNASVFTPSAGYLGYKLQGKTLSQLTSRLYGRYVSEPEKDIDMLIVNVAAWEDKLHLQADYNLEVPKEIILALNERLAIVMSTVSELAENHNVFGAVSNLKTTVNSAYTKTYTATVKYASELPELKTLIDQHQKIIQNLLTAIVRLLRETQINLLVVEEATLPEICQAIRNNAAIMFEQIFHAFTESLKACATHFESIEVNLPWGEVLTADKMIRFLEEILAEIVMKVKQHKSLDVILENLSHSLPMLGEKAKDLIDFTLLNAGYLVKYIEMLYFNAMYVVGDLIAEANHLLTTDGLKNLIDKCMELIANVMNEFANSVSNIIPTDNALLKVENGRLEIDLPLPFHH
ncbi:apolipoprotein Bb, tandem duplicate 1 [Trichomycterus rosablanca]|uniref:apolipoprotein Bb, tandem duplicate 1 n=1 Tax=Trichomycterus rosablanca TaxID=2290929 RepID=UPI002F35D954